MIDWPAIYAHLIASTGWTWEYIAEHVDLPRLKALTDYWQQQPPVHVMVAAYLGCSKKTSQQPIQNASEFVPVNTVTAPEFDEVLRSFGIPDSVGL